jgi:hypothetical protein
MCAWPLNFIYVMCATVKHIIDSDKNILLASFFSFFHFLDLYILIIFVSQKKKKK